MKQLLFILLLSFSATTLFGKDQVITIKKCKNISNEEKDVEVTCKIDEGNCTITINKDGETETFTFPFNDEEALEKAEAAIEKITGCLKDVDVDVAWFGKGPKRLCHFIEEETTWLGVQIQPLTEQLRDYFKVRRNFGVLVTEVVEDSPADKAGLKAGDVILYVDREKINDYETLVDVIKDKEPGEEVKIKIIRDEKREYIRATLDRKKIKKDKRHKFLLKKEGFPPFPDSLQFDWDKDWNDFLPFHRKYEDLTKELKQLKDDINQMKKEFDELKKE